MRHLNNGTDHRHSKSCCDQSSPARRTISHDPMVVVVCLHITLHYYRRYAELSESIGTSEMLDRYILSLMYLRLGKFSQSSSIKYIGLCVFSLFISRMMTVRFGYVLYLIRIIKSAVWPICHCLGLGQEAMVCAVCHFIFVCTCCTKAHGYMYGSLDGVANYAKCARAVLYLIEYCTVSCCW